jgi:hypothetical protein
MAEPVGTSNNDPTDRVILSEAKDLVEKLGDS